MSATRTYIPPRRQALGSIGEPPACGPFYDQPTLPNNGVEAGAIGPPANPADSRQRFHRFNSIVCPAAGTSLALITSYTVPDGHRAFAVGLLLRYEGTGFVEGDATLLFFSIRLNGASFVPDYASIPNTLGSLTAGPWPLPGRLKLFAADLVEILVTVPGGSTIATGGTNRVHGHLTGYYEPNQ
jgi:hypothetical protein